MRLFGLSVAELREAIRLFLNRPDAAGGMSLARWRRNDFAEEQASVAANDFLRAARRQEETLDKESVAQLDSKISEVEALLAKAIDE